MQKSQPWLQILLLLIVPLPAMGIDLLAPSLPHIAAYFHVSPSLSKLTISIYMYGYALGLGCFGIASDYMRRKPLLLLGLMSYLVVSFFAAQAGSIKILLGLRCLQGFFAGAFASLARTLLVEMTPNEKVHAISTWISTVWGIGPIIAPALGGYLQHYFSWRAGFYFFTGYSLLFVVLYGIFLPETFMKRTTFNTVLVWKNCLHVLRQKVFLGISILMGLNFGVLILFATLGPFIIQVFFHKTVIFYGNVALGLGLVYFLCSFFAKKVITTFSAWRLIPSAIFLGVFLILLMFVMAPWLKGWVLAALLLITAMLYFMTSLLYPACMSVCFKLSRDLPGTYNAMNLMISLLTASSLGALASATHTHHWQELFIFDLLAFGLMGMVFKIFMYNREVD